MIDVEYDALGRMKYHPEFHARHKHSWTNKEEQYLIENYLVHGAEGCALALERTIGTVMTRACHLRKLGKIPKRKKGDPTHKRARKS